jgi:hypothetical protein
MKKLVAIVIIVLIVLSFVACNPSNFALWKKQRDTGYNGGLWREVTITNTFTGQVVFHQIDKCFIADDATPGDIMILWSESNKKTDFVGYGLSMVAVEISEEKAKEMKMAEAIESARVKTEVEVKSKQ